MDNQQLKKSHDRKSSSERPNKSAVPCEAMVSAVCLLLMAYLLIVHQRVAYENAINTSGTGYVNPFEFYSVFYSMLISIFSIPLILVSSAWNSHNKGYSYVRNRVLSYLIAMHLVLIITLMLYFFFRHFTLSLMESIDRISERQ